MKAIRKKAWICTNCLVHDYPHVFSVFDWHAFSENKNLCIEPDIVRFAHARGLEKKPDDFWQHSAILWELTGVKFALSFYDALWKSARPSRPARNVLFQLGKLHRFEPIDLWLSIESARFEEDIQDVLKRLWSHAIHHVDEVLLAWLNRRTPRSAAMRHIYDGINARSLLLSSRTSGVYWNIHYFLTNGLAGLSMPIDEFCQYVALYNGPRLKHIWSKMEECTVIPVEWRVFLASGAKQPVSGNHEQGLVMVFRELFPDKEAERMQQYCAANSAEPVPQVYLVDLL
jgi:hypothetical protein